MFQSTKLEDGFSACFRQWKATTTHCKHLHGYALSFKIVFEGELDYRNWIVDFGGFKRSKVSIDGFSPKEWFKYMFDHTTVISNDDPDLETFRMLESTGAIQLRLVDAVGCEMFAKLVYDKLQDWVELETKGRCRVVSVECKEHEKNSAIYVG